MHDGDKYDCSDPMVRKLSAQFSDICAKLGCDIPARTDTRPKTERPPIQTDSRRKQIHDKTAMENTNKAIRMLSEYAVQNRDAFECNAVRYEALIQAYVYILSWSQNEKPHLKSAIRFLPGMSLQQADTITRLATPGSFASITRALECYNTRYSVAFLDLIEAFVSDDPYDVLVCKLDEFISRMDSTMTVTLTAIISSLQPENFITYDAISLKIPSATEFGHHYSERSMKNYHRFNELYRCISTETKLDMMQLYLVANADYYRRLDAALNYDDCHDMIEHFFLLANWHWYMSGNRIKKQFLVSGDLPTLYYSAMRDTYNVVLYKASVLNPVELCESPRILAMVEGGCIISKYAFQTHKDKLDNVEDDSNPALADFASAMMQSTEGLRGEPGSQKDFSNIVHAAGTFFWLAMLYGRITDDPVGLKLHTTELLEWPLMRVIHEDYNAARDIASELVVLGCLDLDIQFALEDGLDTLKHLFDVYASDN